MKALQIMMAGASTAEPVYENRLYFTAGAATGNDWVEQYKLTTEKDITTIASSGSDYTISTRTIRDIFVKPDGTKMYISISNTQTVEYTLSTPYDSHSASVTYTFTLTGDNGNQTTMYFKDDGTKLYVSDSSDNKIYQYSLSSAWDLSTASQDGSVSFTANYYKGIAFSSDGGKVYLTSAIDGKIKEFSLSTAWDVTDGISDTEHEISNGGDNLTGVDFSYDGTVLWTTIGGSGFTLDVVQYNLSTAWDISSAVEGNTENIAINYNYAEGFCVTRKEV